MAYFPCMVHGSRFSGNAQNVYLTVLNGKFKESYRLIVCPVCVDDLVNPWVSQALWRDDEGDWRDPMPEDKPERHQTVSQGRQGTWPS